MTDDLYERESATGGQSTTDASTAPPETHAAPPAGPPEPGNPASGWSTSSSGFTGNPVGVPGDTGGFAEQPGSAAGVPPGYTSYRGYAPVGPRPADLPSPGLAAFLGLIPGVGAMYNGQFAKGLAHLAVFAVLVSLADNVNGIFGVFVAGWVFYQAFEAYHTARARQAGLPLPNAFGLNDIGERFGFGKNWPYGTGSVTTAPTPATGATAPPVNTQPVPPPGPAPAWTQGQPYPGAVPAYTPPPYAPAADAAANWAGYIPPNAFAQTPAATVPYTDPVVPSATTSQAGAPNWSSVPFTPAPAAGVVPPNPASPVGPGRRFPAGAVLLIVLGGIFLLSNIAPAWRLGERWLTPLLLAGSGLWFLLHRLGLLSGIRPGIRGGNLVCVLRLPVLLLTLSILFFLQAAGWLTLGQSWPLLLIVLGALLLLERTLGRGVPDAVATTQFGQSVVPPVDPVEGGVR